MPHRPVHTVHFNGQWFNELEGGEQALGAFDELEEAVEAGGDEARIRQVEHVIHDVDGQVAERRSYGDDPRAASG